MFSNLSTLSNSVTGWLGGVKPEDSEEETAPVHENDSPAEPVTESPKKDKPSGDNKEIDTDEAQEGDKDTTEPVLPSEENIQKQLDEAGAAAIHTAKEWGTWLYGMGKTATSEVIKTAKVMKDTVEEKTILGDFQKEQDKFRTENQEKKRKKEVAVAPWVGYNEEEAMKKQILALSQDQRNFLRSPPAGVQFMFDYETMCPVAACLLQEDPGLNKMRFTLVPKQVKEEDFWRNYFYRVSLIKQSAQLTSLAQSTGSTADSNSDTRSTDSLRQDVTREEQVDAPSSAADRDEDLTVGSPPLDNDEFISDAFQPAGGYSEEDLKAEMQQLGMDDAGADSGADAGKDYRDDLKITSSLSDVELRSYLLSLADQPLDGPTDTVPDWEKELLESQLEDDLLDSEELEQELLDQLQYDELEQL